MIPSGIVVLLLAVPAPPTPTAAPALGPAATPVVVKPRSLADVARENRERAEKGEKKEGTFSVSGGGEVAGPDDISSPPPATPKRGKTKAGAAGPAGPAPALEAGAAGPDEATWKSRAQRLREELDAARKAQADEEARRAQLLTKARNSEEMMKFAEEIQQRVNVCRLRVESARKQLEALPEEARKAGVSPGAIR